MAKIPVRDLIALFQRMYNEHWRYVWGKAETGCVDCSGAFVWAYKQFGKTIPHGSNSIARKYCGEMRSVKDAQPGFAAFKYHAEGDKDYDLPSKYRKGGSAHNGDLRDYYHIGLVDESGKYVLNAQGEKAGFTRTKLSAWGCVAPLNAVDYPEKESDKQMDYMIVTAEGGGTVRVRKSPSISAAHIDTLAVGTAVQAGPDENGWRSIVYGHGKTGYMMSKFLVPIQTVEQKPTATPTDIPLPVAPPTVEAPVQIPGQETVGIVLPYDAALALRDALITAMGVG